MIVEPLYMVLPQAVPSESAVSAWRDGARQTVQCVMAAMRGLGETPTHDELLSAVGTLLAHLPLPESTAAQSALPDDRLHDAYFHVLRTDGDNVAVLLRTTIVARQILMQELDEAAVDFSRPFLNSIDRGLADMLACLIGQPAGTLPSVREWVTRGNRNLPLPRWIRGHQIFATLTQGLLLSFGAMGRAIRRGQFEDVRYWADLSASLLHASGSAFALTGDFSVEDYTRDIRPSMMPPASPICLSGLMSLDHRLLVVMIRDLKPALKLLREQERARHDAIHEALKTVYDQHILVCERFVGKRPSLLTQGTTEKSGPQLIEQFKTLRLKAFESNAHISRLKTKKSEPVEGQCPASEQPPESHESDSKY